MNKRILGALMIVPILFTFWRCSLSASQEAALNSSLSNYIQARNDCQVVGLVGFTYPELVKDFKSISDSVFKTKFDCDKSGEYYYQIQNPTLRSTVSEGKNIHVLYEFDGYGEQEDEYKKRNFKLVAISENKGENWFFISKTDYDNDTLCKQLKRLL